MMRFYAGWIVAVLLCSACGGGDRAASLKEVQRAKAGALNIVLLSEGDSLKRGKGGFVVEFRDASGSLVDVGNVTISATMPMAGMAPMFGESTVMPTEMRGRYEVASDLEMAGTWRLNIAWDGPAGKGSTSVPGTVL
jgi:YtkA-like